MDQQAEQFHKIALMHAKNKNFVEAINSWVKAISLNSNDPDYYFNLGIAFFEIKNYKESIENLNKALSLCPIYYKAHIILGTVYLKVRQFEDSEQHLKESINFYPNHALAYLNLGAVYSILKRYDDAITAFSKALELSPNEVRAHFGIGKIYSLKNDSEKANSYFKRVIELDQKGQLANHAKRAMMSKPVENGEGASESVESVEAVNTSDYERLYQEGYKAFLFTDYNKAIMMYNGYLKRKPDDDFVWFSLSEAYLRAGNTQKAIEALQKAISINANKAIYYKELAIAYNYLDDEGKVIDCLDKAKRLGKSDSVTNTLWGKFLLKSNRHSDAIETLEQAVKRNSNNLLAKFHLALAYLEINQKNFAISYLKEIISSPINSPLKMEAQSALEELNAS
ncbi:tetratricopeptide repeat protein [candidate division KSB1 bacterium]|nr:tetratricopeptide repeat protein [candidate division KSB1 bacterium]NIR70407.1 tetratricopeptide repeat protein [candidate division KSB1 bacterium]NIS25947.1 tetratricopeptide repeat protein [candidate division KSB1 bacterium]NIT69970.1 tetratricopeptide repeat protein [candidate division KSB1 bacterium]NIU26635.1 tetratricopeptide repeat protein [candidate division KSB1 bacterium]